VTLALPIPKLSIGGNVFRVPGVPFPVMVDEGWAVVPRDPRASLVHLAVKLGLVDEDSAEPGTPYFISNGSRTVGLIADRDPAEVQARRLLPVAPPAFAEVVTLDSVEGLLLYPERL
jgi:hypothetical protein